jgi:hypothetical protein
MKSIYATRFPARRMFYGGYTGFLTERISPFLPVSNIISAIEDNTLECFNLVIDTCNGREKAG